jgi:hypothetical protein
MCPTGSARSVAVPGPHPLGGGPSSWTNITPGFGMPNPTPRELPAEAYYPSGHEVLLFGGVQGAEDYLQDTWGYANGKWTEINNGSNCTATTCPGARAGAMLAYDPEENAMLLFGGYWSIFVLHTTLSVAYNDTWLFKNDTWTQITASAGTPPSPRFEGAMSYDPSDNYILLFGGANATGVPMGGTYQFSDGVWTNLTLSLGVLGQPDPRAGMAIADSPDGYVLMYGGMDASGVIQNPCSSSPSLYGSVALWFYKGAWSYQNYSYLCPPPNRTGASGDPPPPGATYPPSPPCGRVGAYLAWSPKNNRFILFGGYGSAYSNSSDSCDTSSSYLSDTWSYALPSGGGFDWYAVTGTPNPPASAYGGYASDFTDGYFEIFGGEGATGYLLNDSWRFYEVLFARLTGPGAIVTQPGQLVLYRAPFLLTGYGGTGDLDYKLSLTTLLNHNTMSGNAACAALMANTDTPLPYNGTWDYVCEPNPKAFNIYRVTLTIIDEGNSSHPTATATWTFEILPPEAIDLYSQYLGYFYQTVSFTDTFGLYAEVSNGPATKVVASIGGINVVFHQQSFNKRWWNASVQMSDVPKGAVLHVEAFFDSNWSQNISYSDFTMISFPSWLTSVFDFSGSTITPITTPTGPWNNSYAVDVGYTWNAGGSGGFSVPTELVGGGFSMFSGWNVTFTLTSEGTLSIGASLPIASSSIDMGPATAQFSVFFSLNGTFAVTGSSVTWVSVSATLTADINASMYIPIWGFSIAGVINVGFYLSVEISASFALELILAPTQPGHSDLVPGVQIELQQLLGILTVGIAAAANFGIGIASVGLGGSVSVALAMELLPSFGVGAGWVNGTIFGTASFLWWSTDWDILGPGVIYSWGDPPGSPRTESGGSGYNNGSTAPWTLESPYFETSGYEADVWDPDRSSGPALSDIYPDTTLTGAGGANGAYLFYSNENATDPVDQGLGISGAELGAGSNALSGVPVPAETGYLLASPRATTLANGDLFVVWDALPTAEGSLASPLDLTSIALQGAQYDPANHTWGPIVRYSHGGIVQSAVPDAVGDSGEVLALQSTTPLLSGSAPESLVSYNLTTGAPLENHSLSGLSEVVGVRPALGLGLVQELGGNYTLVNLTSGDLLPIAYTPPHGDYATSASFLQDSPSTIALVYRNATASLLVLYDAATGHAISTLPIGPGESDVQGIADGTTDYVFVRGSAGIQGWSVSNGAFANLSGWAESGISHYGIVEDAGSIALYALVQTGGNETRPIDSLAIDEIGATLPIPPSPAGKSPSPSSPSTGSGSSSSGNYTLYLEIAAGVVVLALVIAAIIPRRRPPVASPPPPVGAGGPGAGPAPSAAPPIGPGPPPSGPPGG